ncbi:MAG: cyclic nucleotide-binding domain-containing protein [Burkholderiales bacterium]|jgi:CRP-like cAMP-binding protein|nr:cyclic nucleotide-binding domain-containing protein [Burkholderiales bacterium]
MSDLDFTRPAQSEVYSADVSRRFFGENGRPQAIAAGSALFAENAAGNTMYFLASGEVALTRGGRPLDVIKAGEVLGEMSVLTGEPRSATATARGACEVIGLDGDAFLEAIRKTPDFALMLLAILIKRLRLALAMQMLGRNQNLAPDTVPVSGEVFDKDLLTELTTHFPGRPPVYQPKNGVIMREGEAGIFMYVVIDGAVRITAKDSVVEVVRPGGVFGEMALVDQSKRAATASAATDCNLLSINRNDFLALIRSNPAFGVSLLRALANRLRNTGRR